MKKIIYSNIVLIIITVASCRNQDNMVQLAVVKPTNITIASATNVVSANYAAFDSSSATLGDPAKPPRD